MTPAGENALDPDRLLALSYVPAVRRPALAALWRLDAALGAVLAGGRDPSISRIKLAWWREALERLDREPPPPLPLLQALADHVIPAGLRGADLAGMEEAWNVLLSADPLDADALDTYAARRGGPLFICSARLLGGQGPDHVREAGEAWALVDFARHCGDRAEADLAVAAALARGRPLRWPPLLRPLGMLAALSRRDAEPGRRRWERQGAPGRMVRMLRHRLTGY